MKFASTAQTHSDKSVFSRKRQRGETLLRKGMHAASPLSVDTRNSGSALPTRGCHQSTRGQDAPAYHPTCFCADKKSTDIRSDSPLTFQVLTHPPAWERLAPSPFGEGGLEGGLKGGLKGGRRVEPFTSRLKGGGAVGGGGGDELICNPQQHASFSELAESCPCRTQYFSQGRHEDCDQSFQAVCLVAFGYCARKKRMLQKRIAGDVTCEAIRGSSSPCRKTLSSRAD